MFHTRGGIALIFLKILWAYHIFIRDSYWSVIEIQILKQFPLRMSAKTPKTKNQNNLKFRKANNFVKDPRQQMIFSLIPGA